MPTKVEKDSVTGTQTTGHEWDGIKELNTPLPRWWLYVFYATILWSIVYWVLYPAIPTWSGYTKGVIGGTEREALQDRLQEARAGQAVYLDRIQVASVEEIAGDADLLNFAIAGGRAAFADNCAPCHGLGGAGQAGGYPTLADDDWLWGGTREAIQTTLLYGIRSNHDDTRISEMPAFGADGVLGPEEIGDVAEYVLSLSGNSGDTAAAERGAQAYLDNCAACHGEQGEGMADLGAPALDDQIWLYGGDKEAIVAQISKPKHGVMPAWESRLDDTTIKMLATYVHSLGGGE
jgi:cytochrome c oxidase cbb3-type subunit 3